MSHAEQPSRQARIQARMAPRNAWQAMDLGTQLFRHWWRPLVTLWLLTTLPAMALILLLCGGNLFWAGLLFWWLKPVWERPLLEFNARALFGNPPTLRQLLRDFPAYARPYLFSSLTWRRLSPSRSFNAPVYQLERPARDSLQRRMDVLHAEPHQHAGTLTVLLLHVEQFVLFALLSLLYVLMPWQFDLSLIHWLTGEEVRGAGWMFACWYLAMTLTQPLYVSSGFALYLNKRTWLEGWDLEQGLRAIRQRRSRHNKARAGSTATLLLLVLVALPWSDALHAGAAPHAAIGAPAEADTLREEAIQILAGDDLMPMSTHRTWRLRPNDERDGDLLSRLLQWLFGDRQSERSDGSLHLPWLSDGLRILLWTLALVVVVWLLWSGRHLLNNRTTPGRGTAPANTRIAGLDIARESLPDDPASAVHAALAAGDYRLALSLLYRLNVRDLHLRLAIVLPEGATEGELLTLLRRQHGNDRGVDFLSALTPVWLRTAWGHRPVSHEEVAALTARWFSRDTGDDTGRPA
ncbi:DUF4129 domain-containing protein [Alcanivorax sp. JB21]|uniref:DUF4129 domain-containing protein n=1 Tax=Alcanivorax limicola TaxID=2874102 RepID=UPI001CBB1031|nr:DUF4129 domain-containing protein [Alcanivorax limicola]MBZ2188450.1 DUF4129 domain-containing protein [Alcanivorax limicola]